MMSDLISRQSAIDIAMQYCPDDDGSCSKAGADIREMLDELEDLPSSHEDIVYCRECIHGEPNGKYGCRVYHYKICEVHGMGANDFCSKGERR